MGNPHAHCGHCGAAFAPDAAWPRRCVRCDALTYRNPIPVGVVLVPVDDGLLVVRRAIPPGRGQLALPGGFIDHGESWRVGAAREVYEETGVSIDDAALTIDEVHSTPDGRLVLLFCRAPRLSRAALPPFTANDEVSEVAVIERPEPLAFELHTLMCARFFAAAGR